MATRFYLSSTTTTPVTPAFEGGWSRNSEGDRRAMSPTKDGSAATSKTCWANAAAAADTTCLNRQFVSDPMEAGVAFAASDTFKCQIRCQESATNDNVNRNPICIKVVSQDGNTVRQVLKSLGHYGPNTTEWLNTGLRNKTFGDSDTLDAGYTTVAGDRLVIEVGGQVSNVGGTSVTATQSFGSDNASDLGENETDTTALNAWFETSRTVTFVTVASVAGQVRAAAETLVNKFVLAYRASPVSVAGLLLGVLSTTLVGTLQSAPQLRGTLTMQSATTPVAGAVQAAGVLSGALGTKVALIGTIGAQSQLIGQLQSVTSLSGSIDAQPGLIGQLQSVVALGGQSIAQPASLGQLQMQGVTTSLSGVIQAAPRLAINSITLAYRATPSVSQAMLLGDLGTAHFSAELMGQPVLHGTLSIVGGIPINGLLEAQPTAYGVLTSRVALGGVVSSAPVLVGNVASKVALTGVVSVAPQLFGSIEPRAPLAGLVSVAPQLVGALQTKVALTGLVSAAPQLVGALSTRVSIAGVVSSAPQLVGALQFQGTVVSVSGVIESNQVLSGLLDVWVYATPVMGHGWAKGTLSFAGVASLSGLTLAAPQLVGSLTVRLALVGKLSAAPQLFGTLTSRVALSGRILAAPRLIGSTQTVTALSGVIRSEGLVTGVLTIPNTRVAGLVGAAPRLSGVLSTRVALSSTIQASGLVRGRLVEPGTYQGILVGQPVAYGVLTTRLLVSSRCFPIDLLEVIDGAMPVYDCPDDISRPMYSCVDASCDQVPAPLAGMSVVASVVRGTMTAVVIPDLNFLTEDFELASAGAVNNVQFQQQPGFFVGGDAPLVVIAPSTKRLIDDGTADKEGEMTFPFKFIYADSEIVSLTLLPGPDFTTPAQDTWAFRFLKKADGTQFGYMKITPLNSSDTLTSRHYNVEVNLIGGTPVNANVTVTLDGFGAGTVTFTATFQIDVDSIVVGYVDFAGPHSALTWNADAPGQFTSWLSDGIHNRASIFYERAAPSQIGFKNFALEAFSIDNDL